MNEKPDQSDHWLFTNIAQASHVPARAADSHAASATSPPNSSVDANHNLRHSNFCQSSSFSTHSSDLHRSTHTPTLFSHPHHPLPDTMFVPFESNNSDGTASPPGRVESEAPAAAEAPAQLQITFRHNRGFEQAFKLKKTTRIIKAMVSHQFAYTLLNSTPTDRLSGCLQRQDGASSQPAAFPH